MNNEIIRIEKINQKYGNNLENIKTMSECDKLWSEVSDIKSDLKIKKIEEKDFPKEFIDLKNKAFLLKRKFNKIEREIRLNGKNHY